MEIRFAGSEEEYSTFGISTKVGVPSIPNACSQAVPILMAVILNDESSFATLMFTGSMSLKLSSSIASPNICLLHAVSASVGLLVADAGG